MYKLVWNDRVLDIIFNGSVSSAELIGCYSEINSCWKFDNLKFMVFDYSTAYSPRYTVEDMEKFYHYDKAATKSNSRITQIVIATDEGTRALASYYMDISKDLAWETLLVHTREEANELLSKLKR